MSENNYVHSWMLYMPKDVVKVEPSQWHFQNGLLVVKAFSHSIKFF